MRMFSIDGPIYKFMTALTSVFLLSMCFWVSCLPIITIGPAIVATCDVAMKIVDNQEGYIVRQFFKSLKSNFKQGFVLGLMLAIGSYAVFLDFKLFEAMESNPILLVILGILTIFLILSGLMYSFPQVARYENSLHIIVRNSFRIFTKFLFRTIGTIFVMVLLMAAFIYNYTTVFIGFLIGPGCVLYVLSATAKGIFNYLEKDNKAEHLSDEEKNYVEKETVLSTEQYKFANALDENDVKENEETAEVETVGTVETTKNAETDTASTANPNNNANSASTPKSNNKAKSNSKPNNNVNSASTPKSNNKAKSNSKPNNNANSASASKSNNVDKNASKPKTNNNNKSGSNGSGKRNNKNNRNNRNNKNASK